MTAAERLVAYRDEAAFRRAEPGMLAAGWRVGQAGERPYRPLNGFLELTGGFGTPRDPGTLEGNIDLMRLRAQMYYGPAVTPGCLDAFLSLLLLPFFLVGLVVSHALRPLLGSTRYEVLWTRDDDARTAR
jgi:hypothetical protein